MASAPATARPPSVSERKREEIMRAALDLFSRDGYERTSVGAISRNPGMTGTRPGPAGSSSLIPATISHFRY